MSVLASRIRCIVTAGIPGERLACGLLAVSLSEPSLHACVLTVVLLRPQAATEAGRTALWKVSAPEQLRKA